MNSRTPRAHRVLIPLVPVWPRAARAWLALPALGGFLLAVAPVPARAEDVIEWAGGTAGAHVRWGRSDNWSGGVVPGSGSTVAFHGPGTPGAQVVAHNGHAASYTIGNLILDSPAGPIAIPGGSSLAVSGNTIVRGTAAITGTGSFATKDLQLDGSLDLSGFSGQLDIAGHLSGTGTMEGEGLNVGGSHSPGGAPGAAGSQTIRDVRYRNGSIFEWDLTANSEVVGFDVLRGGGEGKLVVGDAVFRIVLGGDASLADDFWRSPREWRVFEGYSSIEGGFSGIELVQDSSPGLMAMSTAASANTSWDGTFSISGGTLSWTPTGDFSPVPEPSALLGGLVLLAGLARRSRGR